MLHLPINPRTLHPLTGLPVQPLGRRKDGRFVWPILGGDDTVDPVPGDPAPVDPPADPPANEAGAGDPAGAEALGDPGKKALDAMKAERNAARDETRALRAEFDAFKAKAEGKEAEHAAAQEAQRVKDEALAAANVRIASAELRAAAKGKVAEDVLADISLFIDPSSFEVGEDGSVDSSAIADAVDNLIKAKPSLAAAQGGSRFQGSADGGVRNGQAKSIDDQIAEATKAGNHQLAVELKRHKAYAT